MNTKCVHCNAQLAPSLEGYRAHLRRFHNTLPTLKDIEAFKTEAKALAARVIKPFRTTTRSKIQIVHDIEKTWGSALIPEVKPWQSLGA